MTVLWLYRKPISYMVVGTIAAALMAIPAADVIPVTHSKWDIEVGMNYHTERICPMCKKVIKSNFWEYCPHCGAKMDGGEKK